MLTFPADLDAGALFEGGSVEELLSQVVGEGDGAGQAGADHVEHVQGVAFLHGEEVVHEVALPVHELGADSGTGGLEEARPGPLTKLRALSRKAVRLREVQRCWRASLMKEGFVHMRQKPG